MLIDALTIARKEIIDHARDIRSLISTLLYTLMGPAIVGALALRLPMNTRLGALASVFTLVAAFTGGMSVAVDTIAGERERRSLLPLILGVRSSRQILLGKWMATVCFAIVNSMITLGCFALLALLCRVLSPRDAVDLVWAVPALAALAAMASAFEIVISAVARNVKEANTYISVLTFAATAASMWLALLPPRTNGWWDSFPVLGHQQLLQAGLSSSVAVSPVLTTAATLTLTLVVLVQAMALFRTNEIHYRN